MRFTIPRSSGIAAVAITLLRHRADRCSRNRNISKSRAARIRTTSRRRRAPAGSVYYTAQVTGKLGILDPSTGRVEEIALGANSAPHGVVVGPDGAPWITDGGQNAIVRVDPVTHAVRRAGRSRAKRPTRISIR